MGYYNWRDNFTSMCIYQSHEIQQLKNPEMLAPLSLSWRRARFKTLAFESFYGDNFDLNSLNKTVGFLLIFYYPPTQHQQTNSLTVHKSGRPRLRTQNEFSWYLYKDMTRAETRNKTHRAATALWCWSLVFFLSLNQCKCLLFWLMCSP